MKTITLLKMELANFKGVHSQEIVFSQSTRIIGANATGKSTIFEAYLWCLFGKSASGGDCAVQPLDKSGEPIHKLATEVILHLAVDGSPIVLKRQLEEQWVKPKGTNQEVLKGTPTAYFVNDVPCKASEYADKINAILPAADWMMVSNIATFNSMTTADKRKKLNDAVKHITDATVAAEGFPCVEQAIKEGKTVEEFRREICAKRKKSKEELDEIPARIDQQEKLRVVGVDFTALRTGSVAIEKEIAAIDSKLQNEISQQSISQVDDMNRDYRELSEAKSEIENSLVNELGSKNSALDAKIREIADRKQVLTAKYNVRNGEVGMLTKERADLKGKLAELSAQWEKVNESIYVDSEIEVACPCCNRPYTAEELVAMQSSSVERFNTYKLRQLNDIVSDAENTKSSIDALTNSLNATARDAGNISGELLAIGQEEEAARKEKDGLPTIGLLQEASKEYQTICQKLLATRAAISSVGISQQSDNAALKGRKAELQAELKVVQSQLGKEAGNVKIDIEKQKLEERSATLTQALTDMDAINFEIDNFLKRKITLIEDAVSSNFLIAKWKLFEPNLTNDGERPICEALVDGVPYAQLNTAMRINAGIDICAGLSKALGISAPLFVDNKESVTELLQITQQLITMEVVAGQELTIINQ